MPVIRGERRRRLNLIRHPPRQRERRLATKRCRHETGRRHEQRGVRLHGLRRLIIVHILHVEPAVEPRVRRPAQLVHVAVGNSGGLKRHAVAGAKESVHALVFVEEIVRAGHVFRGIRVTGIVQRDRHQQRLRRERIEQVRSVDPASQRRHDILLGVVR